MKRLEPLRLFGGMLLFLLLAISLPLVTPYAALAEENSHDSDSDEDQSNDEAGYEEYDDGDYEEDADSEYYTDDTSESSEDTPFDDLVTINENDIVTLNVLGNDRAVIGWDRSPRLMGISEPASGQVLMNSDGTITYSPSQVPLPAGYEKADTMSYTASANGIPSYSGMVTVRVVQLNDPPVASSANYTIDENQPVVFELYAFDEDNDSITFETVSTPAFGKVELDTYTGSVTYSPLYEFSGKEFFGFQVSDGIATSEVESIVFTVLEVGGETSPVFENNFDEDEEEDDDDGDSVPDEPEDEENPTDENTEPVANAGSNFTALAGDLVTLDAGASHDDGDLIEYSWSQGSGPSVSLEGLETANPAFTAPDVDSETLIVFELTVSDGNLTDSASITVTVVPLSIDVIPNVNPNLIKLGSPDEEIPVAIFGNSFLNVTTGIHQDTLRMGPNSASITRSELTDVNDDGITDHISYYRTGDLGLKLGDKNACLSGTVETENANAVEFSECKKVKVSQ